MSFSIVFSFLNISVATLDLYSMNTQVKYDQSRPEMMVGLMNIHVQITARLSAPFRGHSQARR